MGTRTICLAFVIIALAASGFSQEKRGKVEREKRRYEKAHQIDSLMKAKTFVFIASRALPQGGGTVDLTTNSNSIKFQPGKIECYMPFFGRAYHIGYGGDGGIKFEGAPLKYTIESRKRGTEFEVNAGVSVTQDSFQLSLSVNNNGSATLTISSNQRSTISYFGEILKLEAPKDK